MSKFDIFYSWAQKVVYRVGVLARAERLAHDVMIFKLIQNHVHSFNIFERVNGTDVCLSTICTVFLVTSLITITVFSSHYFAGYRLSTVCVYSFLCISDSSPLKFVFVYLPLFSIFQLDRFICRLSIYSFSSLLLRMLRIYRIRNIWQSWLIKRVLEGFKPYD